MNYNSRPSHRKGRVVPCLRAPILTTGNHNMIAILLSC